MAAYHLGRNIAPDTSEPIGSLGVTRHAPGRAIHSTWSRKATSSFRTNFRSLTPDPLTAIHFANYSRTVDRAAKMGGKVVRITIERPCAYRDIGDLINLRLVSREHAKR